MSGILIVATDPDAAIRIWILDESVFGGKIESVRVGEAVAGVETAGFITGAEETVLGPSVGLAVGRLGLLVTECRLKLGLATACVSPRDPRISSRDCVSSRPLTMVGVVHPEAPFELVGLTLRLVSSTLE